MRAQVPPIFVSSTPVMMVQLECVRGEWPSARGFSASFAGTPARATHLPPGVFHHMAWTLTSSGVATLFINGTQQQAGVIQEGDQERRPLKDDGFPTAIGRGAPAWQDGGEIGYPCVALDEMRIWTGVRSEAELSAGMLVECGNLPHDQNASLLACYGFDTTQTSGAGTSGPFFPDKSRNSIPAFVAKRGPWFRPHCVNVDDEGAMALDSNTSPENNNFIDWTENRMWGYCTSKLRLPGLGLDYSESDIEMAVIHSSSDTAAILDLYPGCGSVPMRLEYNTAGKQGGAIYYDSCYRLDKVCFLSGIGPMSGSRAILLRHNSAQAGGAVYVDCIDVGGDCREIFRGSNTVGALPHLAKVEFTGSVSSGYGDKLASQPAAIQWYPASPNGTEVVPSDWQSSCSAQDSSEAAGTIDEKRQLRLGVQPVDSLNSIARGIDDVVEIRVCATKGECNKETALMPVTFETLDEKRGAGSWPRAPACALGESTIAAELSLVRYATVRRLRAVIQCGRCRTGESKTEDKIRKIWFCKPCASNQYVKDPNNVAHACHDCPAGAACREGSFIPAPGSVWEAGDNGAFVIKSCASGSSIVRSPYLQQACRPCDAGFYCTGGSDPELRCPPNTFSKALSSSKEACVESEFVEVTLNLPITKADFTAAKQLAFKKSIAAAAGTNESYVEIVSFAQVSTRRSARALLAASLGVETRVATMESSTKEILGALDEEAINTELAKNGMPESTVSTIRVLEPAPAPSPPWNTLHTVLVVSGGVVLAILGVGWMLWSSGKPAERSEEMKREAARQRVEIRKREFDRRSKAQSERDERQRAAQRAPKTTASSPNGTPSHETTGVTVSAALGHIALPNIKPSSDTPSSVELSIAPDKVQIPTAAAPESGQSPPPAVGTASADPGGTPTVAAGKDEWGKFETQKITLGKAYQSVLTAFIGLSEKRDTAGLSNPLDAIEREFYPFGFHALEDEPADNFDEEYRRGLREAREQRLRGGIDDDAFNAQMGRLMDEFQSRKYAWWIAGANFDYVRYGVVGGAENPEANFWLPPQVLRSFETGECLGVGAVCVCVCVVCVSVCVNIYL